MARMRLGTFYVVKRDVVCGVVFSAMMLEIARSGVGLKTCGIDDGL